MAFDETVEDFKQAMREHEEKWGRIVEAHRNEQMTLLDWAKLVAKQLMELPKPSTWKFFEPAMAGLIMEAPPRADWLAKKLGLDVWYEMVEQEIARLAAARTTSTWS